VSQTAPQRSVPWRVASRVSGGIQQPVPAELHPSSIAICKGDAQGSQPVAVFGERWGQPCPYCESSMLVSEVQAPGVLMKLAERFGDCDTLSAGISALNCALSFFHKPGE
jgi:hypothetical protein